MKTVFNLEAETECPADGEKVLLRVRLSQRGDFVPVVALKALCQRLTSTPIFQEEFTQNLALAYPGAKIKTVGTHQGVLVTCRSQ